MIITGLLKYGGLQNYCFFLNNRGEYSVISIKLTR